MVAQMVGLLRLLPLSFSGTISRRAMLHETSGMGMFYSTTTTNHNASSSIVDTRPAALNRSQCVSSCLTGSEDDDGSLYVEFYGDVTAQRCHELVEDLRATAYLRTRVGLTWPIHLHIQSGGGDLLPALYVYDFIQGMDAPVVTHVDGFCASAATLIAMGGTRRLITPHSSFLVHQVRSQTAGRVDDMSAELANIEGFEELVQDIYLERTTLDVSTLKDIMASERWLDAKCALDYGFVDEIG
tara:strand:- start:9 stop:734 length:726 start_codon:yes stop_codon:yes gene_type:complete